jgi:hypothetical protein
LLRSCPLALFSLSGFIKQHRAKQQEEWLWRLVHEEMRRSFDTCPAVVRELPLVMQALAKEEIFPWDGARQLLDIYFGHFVCASTPSTITTTVREEISSATPNSANKRNTDSERE